MSRETALVELVDATGTAIGVDSVAAAHRAPGRLHRAFSVLLFDGAGRTLVQRRAAVKTRFALRWGNTCCGHPPPGADLAGAAAARLAEELGVPTVVLTPIGVYLYRAEDPATGRVEHEYDHVLTGSLASDVALRLDPTEVAEVAWHHPDDLLADLAAEPDRYAPWFSGVLKVFAGTAGGR